jgi:hypothetical protein
MDQQDRQEAGDRGRGEENQDPGAEKQWTNSGVSAKP